MALQKQVIPLKIAGLNGKADSKVAPPGTLSTAENVIASRRTSDGGVEIRKRNGFTPLTTDILGGGSVASGKMIGVLNDEIILCDGLKLYSYSPSLLKWVARGRVQSISADITLLSGNESAATPTTVAKRNVDSAISGNYEMVASTSSDGVSPSNLYIIDRTTKDIIAHSSIGADAFIKGRVVALGTGLYAFGFNAGAGKIQVVKVDTSAPTTFSAVTDVASSSNGTRFDVAVDATNTRIVVAYRNATPTLTLLQWLTNMTAGTSAAYASVDPNETMGFVLNSTGTLALNSGDAYLVVATDTGGGGTPHEVRQLTFSATTMVVGATSTLESYASGITRQATGYRSTVNNLFWTRTVGADGHNLFIRGASNGSLYDVMRSSALASRAFKIGSNWYFVAAYQSNLEEHQIDRQRTFMLELQQDATGTPGSISIAGYLLAENSLGMPLSDCCLPSVSLLSATTATFASPVGIMPKTDGATASTERCGIVQIDLDWGGSALGAPVVYNGVLHIPGAVPKVYDGHFVHENGFINNPDKPYSLTGGTSGSLTLLGVYQYCVVYARTDSAGRITRSAPGPIASHTLTGSNNKITVSIPTHRITENEAIYNLNSEVRKTQLELYRTQANLPNFYLCGVVDNAPRSDAVVFVDTLSDANLIKNELLYTTGDVVDHVFPPAVKCHRAFGDRLFSLTGDGSVWFTKESAEGFGAEFSDEFRILTADAGGKPTALGSVDATGVIFKKKRAYAFSGAGPDDKGVGPFPAPQPLEPDMGVAGPGALADGPRGILCQTPTGWFTLTRGLGFEPTEGSEGYVVTARGAAPVDSRPFTVVVTDGAVLVRDWQLGQWYGWTKSSSGLSGVGAAVWRGQLVILRSDGTVHAEVEGQSFDGTSTTINEKVEFSYADLKNCRVYRLGVVGEIMGTTTLTETVTYNNDDGTAESKTRACTTADKQALNVVPSTGRAESVKIMLQETSTTAGFRLSEVNLEVGVKGGLKKYPHSRDFA